MNFLGKKKKKEDKDSAQNVESAPLEPDLSGGDNEKTAGTEESDILSQYASGDQALQTDDDKSGGMDPEASGGSSSDGDDDVGSELMDIFTSEEAEGGIDVGAMADILEDIDIHSLIEEAKNVETRLRKLVQAAQ